MRWSLSRAISIVTSLTLVQSQLGLAVYWKLDWRCSTSSSTHDLSIYLSILCSIPKVSSTKSSTTTLTTPSNEHHDGSMATHRESTCAFSLAAGALSSLDCTQKSQEYERRNERMDG